MSDYVSVTLSTDAFWQPSFRSVDNGCLIGDGGSSAPASFWLTRPSGTNYNLMTSGSDLRDSVDTWFSQRNAERVLCINTGSVNAATVVDEVPRPLPDGTETDFFVSANPVDSIDAVTLVIGSNTYDLPDGGYSYAASQSGGEYTGEVVITPAPPRGTVIYVDYTADALSTALRLAMSEDVAIVALCNNTTLADLQYLANHVDLAFSSLRFRIGVAMLPQGQTLTGTYRNWANSLQTENMILVAHNSSEDAAAAFAGVLSGLRVFDDPILASVSITVPADTRFTDNDRLSFQQNHVVCIDQYYTNETGVRALRNYNLSGTSDRQYIDFVRTYQDLMYRLISTLDNPNVIGKISYTPAGMAKLKSKIMSAFLTPIQIGEIVRITGIDIPLEQIINKTPASRTSAETTELTNARARRTLENITVTYEAQSWVNDLDITLKVV